ncbi:MAG: glycosyltransferase, partial [Actinomycetota bacterium]|nr:glycosyltransferase [Actinomycetota bacterium]MDP2287432.1 glycosyltransferase [Actinomycetota bacterium]
MTDQPWLSIVTVVKDAPAELARSLHSLSNQDLSNVEYIVIDSSEDADQVPTLLAQTEPRVDFQWTPPAGIYSAMNLGLEKAHGRYIYFLNAGDELLPEVLGRVRAIAESTDASWLIGTVEVIAANGSSVTTPVWDFQAEQRALFARGHFAPHQGTFASVHDLRSAGGFDPSFHIAADYAAFLQLSKLSTPVMVHFPIARFHEGGLSTQRWQASFREFHRARRTILRPRGSAAARELLSSGRHFLAVGIYRGIWSKVVRHGQ